MSAVFRGTVLARKLQWWELLLDAPECWASIKKSFRESISGNVQYDKMRCSQSHLFLLSEKPETNWRGKNDKCAAFDINIKKPMEAYDGCRITHRLLNGSLTEDGRSFHHCTTGGLERHLQTSSSINLLVPIDWDLIWSSNVASAIKLFKQMQPSHSTTCSCVKSDALLLENEKLDIPSQMAFSMPRCQQSSKCQSRALTHHSFLVSRPYSTQSFGCRTEAHRHSNLQPFVLFGRAFSVSTEKQFDEDISDLQSSVAHHQQSSPGGQQSSLELPESKPVSAPSWPNPDNAASYVLMSNIYADGDRWDEVKRINEMRLKARAWKKPGKAYVEIKAKVHEFIVGDRTHQDSTNIYEKLRKIKRHMGHIGYVPYVDLVLENRSYYDPYYKPR